MQLIMIWYDDASIKIKIIIMTKEKTNLYMSITILPPIRVLRFYFIEYIIGAFLGAKQQATC